MNTPAAANFDHIKALLGTDKELARQVQQYCAEMQEPTLLEMQESLEEPFNKLLTSYESDTTDTDQGRINFVLAGVEVEFSYSPGWQSVSMGDISVELDQMPFPNRPSIWRNYMNSRAARAIERECAKVFPQYDPKDATNAILELIQNRDPCAH